MAYFPLFIELKDRKCVVIGGGKVAARKVATLLQFGAAVTVISISCDTQLRQLTETGQITYWERSYRAGDLKSAFLAVAATDDPAVNDQIAQEAEERGVWVDMADRGNDRAPGESAASRRFLFPAVVRRGQIVVGITTGGAFPALSKKIREKIEAELPAEITANMEALSEARDRVKREIPDPERRRAVLNQLAEDVLKQEGKGNGDRGRDGKKRS